MLTPCYLLFLHIHLELPRRPIAAHTGSKYTRSIGSRGSCTILAIGSTIIGRTYILYCIDNCHASEDKGMAWSLAFFFLLLHFCYVCTYCIHTYIRAAIRNPCISRSSPPWPPLTPPIKLTTYSAATHLQLLCLASPSSSCLRTHSRIRRGISDNHRPPKTFSNCLSPLITYTVVHYSLGCVRFRPAMVTTGCKRGDNPRLIFQTTGIANEPCLYFFLSDE